MTCIVGLKHNDVVYIGADSFAGNDWIKQEIFAPKVFKNKEFVVGYTSSFRYGQLLQYQLEYPDLPEELDLGFLVKNFAEPARNLLKDSGYSEINNNVQAGGESLIGIRNRLFKFQSDFSLTEYYSSFFSVGCGQYSALGALNALDFVSMNTTMKAFKPEIKVYVALASAARSVPSVCMPYVVMSTDGLNRTFDYDPD